MPRSELAVIVVRSLTPSKAPLAALFPFEYDVAEVLRGEPWPPKRG
jgi:hypothetical protein